MSRSDPPTPSAAAILDKACADATQLQVAGHLDLAERLYRSILDAQPGHAGAHHGLGLLGAAAEAALLATIERPDLAAAQAAARALTERFPTRGLGWKALGALLAGAGRTDEAVAAMRTSIRILPDDAEAHANLAVTLSKQLQRHSEAALLLQRAIDLDPQRQSAYLDLVDVLQAQGRHGDARKVIERALALPADRTNPNNAHYTTWIFLLAHDPMVDADTLFAAHRRAAARLEGRAKPVMRHSNPPDPARRLKVGFVSADLCEHPVGQLVEPLVAHLGRSPGLELYAYYNNPAEDAATTRLKRHFSHWHPVDTLTDGELAQQITGDGIDVLIDLAGHTALNRLGAFAYKPAPIQVSWIGYPGTTGLDAMDYYLADPHFLPPGLLDAQFTEKLVYLPATLPLQPHLAAPPVGPLPAAQTGNLTFGSFSRRTKVNEAVIGRWSRLLRALPASRLLIAGISPEYDVPTLSAQFEAEGIDSARLTFHPLCPMDRYLALHHHVDIALDAYPYGGGSTTVNALWMGVPTLTVAGPMPAARQAAGVLGRLGMDEFVAVDAADFVAKGLDWAARLPELAQLRAGLRDRWQTSPVGRPVIIADALERALRRMWTRWCSGLPPQSF